MAIGLSILLLAAGAILTFALDIDVSGVDLDIVGWILMAAGLLGLIVAVAMLGRRRTTVTQSTISDLRQPNGGVVENQRTYEDGPPTV